jgi:uncharacterized protein (DUF2147 family)
MRAAAQWLLAALCMGAATGKTQISAQEEGLAGDWVEPTGSVVHIGGCGPEICLWVVRVSSRAPSNKDIHNPDPLLRDRALCGLKIGSGFQPRDGDHATEGTLYDPKAGKNYRGLLTAKGAKLTVRGYLGNPLFGRSETWTRPASPVQACTGDLAN